MWELFTLSRWAPTRTWLTLLPRHSPLVNPRPPSHPHPHSCIFYLDFSPLWLFKCLDWLSCTDNVCQTFSYSDFRLPCYVLSLLVCWQREKKMSNVLRRCSGKTSLSVSSWAASWQTQYLNTPSKCRYKQTSSLQKSFPILTFLRLQYTGREQRSEAEVSPGWSWCSPRDTSWDRWSSWQSET